MVALFYSLTGNWLFMYLNAARIAYSLQFTLKLLVG